MKSHINYQCCCDFVDASIGIDASVEVWMKALSSDASDMDLEEFFQEEFLAVFEDIEESVCK